MPILIVAACEPGRGGGHLIRGMALVRELRALGRDAWLYITSSNADAVLDTAQFDRLWLLAENDLREKIVASCRKRLAGKKLAMYHP